MVVGRYLPPDKEYLAKKRFSDLTIQDLFDLDKLKKNYEMLELLGIDPGYGSQLKSSELKWSY